MLAKRSCGILLHPTSLPGPHGIGGLGREARDFVDFLAEAGQGWWQILPCGPVDGAFGNSPYMSLSAFAGTPLLVDPEWLVEKGLLDAAQLGRKPFFPEYLVDYDAVAAWKGQLLGHAFREFVAGGGSPALDSFASSLPWLDEYCLFSALREHFGLKPWFSWPREVACRRAEALSRWRGELAERILFHLFVQYCFFAQWHELREYAHRRGIGIIGDIPIYVALDSADVWGNQGCFLLDPETSQPTHVAGVPPDYFSETGQRWGNPLFRWHQSDGSLHAELLAWWAGRFRHVFACVDVVRVDHFRGFESYWRIPASEETAVRGEWVKGPGMELFVALRRQLGELPIIAEDLGVITPEVEALRRGLGFPGMKVLQFAFDSDAENLYLPHNYASADCVVYTGTHDNDTTVGWFFSDKVSPAAKDRALRYAHSQVGSPIHWDFIRLAYASVARLAVIPLQDLLGFGGDCRMNVPGTSEGNWQWRCAARFLTGEVAAALRDEAAFYGRLSRPFSRRDPEQQEKPS
ncbi:MAG: 4-alpha-glucanotransferase [Thermodesulfobacteriota bacterium]